MTETTQTEIDEALLIVRGLRSTRIQEVDAAMKALFGKEPAVLVICRALTKVGICNGMMNADVFVALLNVASKLGNALGFENHWLQQAQPAQHGPGILLPGSDKWVK